MVLLTDFYALLDPAAPWLSALFVGSLKGALVLCAAALLGFVWRRKSASVRHLLWAAGLCGLLFMPLLSSSMGMWEVTISSPLVAAEAPRAAETADDLDADAARATTGGVGTNAGAAASATTATVKASPFSAVSAGSWSALSSTAGARWLLLLWLAGALFVLARLVVGVVGVTRTAREAKRLEGGHWDELTRELSAQVGLTRRVTLLQCGEALMPMTCGIISPVVFLPEDAGRWPEGRLRMVLLHELTHVKRRDIFTQMLAQLACAVHWFNPLAWLAARQLRKEQEWACDERVVGMGFDASAYATHLLDIARSLHRSERLVAAGMAIADRSHLEGRLRAILEQRARRRGATRLSLASVVACMAFVVLSLAVIHPSVRAQKPVAPVTGSQAEHRAVAGVGDSRAETPAAGPELVSVGGAAREEAGEITVEKQTVGPSAGPEPGELAANIDASTPAENGLAQNRTGDVTGGAAPSVPQEERQGQPAQAAAAQEPGTRAGADGGGFSDEERRALYLNGVTSEYLQELKEVGYTGLSVEQLVQMRTNAIDADFIRSLKSVGYNNLPTKDLIALRTNGINPEVIKSYQAVDYADFKAKAFISFKSNGVTPAFLASMRAAGYDDLTPKQLVDLKRGGVTGEFIKRMRGQGHTNLSPEQLIELRKKESK